MTCPPAPAGRPGAWASAWSVPPAFATRFGTARVRVRITAEALPLAIDLAESRVPARLELPTSAYPAYRRLRLGPRRVPEVERYGLDQPVAALDIDLIDDLVQRRQALFVPPGPAAVDAACRLAALGLPVSLDRPRRWSPASLQAVVTSLRAADPRARLPRPLQGLRHPLGDGASPSLRDRYGEGLAPCWFVTDAGRVARSEDHAEAGLFLGTVDDLARQRPAPEETDAPSDCRACPELATCAGYWLGVDAGAEAHCVAWRGLGARLRASA